MKVREIMTSNPACCTPETNLKDVSKMMVENDCGCIPVVENQENKKPVGTITDRDITVRTVAMNKNPLDMKAGDIMTTDVVKIRPETSVQHCAQVMKEHDIRRVLVVDKNGTCCGIVAQADVAGYGPNPELISNVVHDISESAPTPVKSDASTSEADYKKSENSKSSFLSLGSVLPLAAGVAAGAAYKYFTASEKKVKTHDTGKYRVNHLPDKTPMPLENYNKGKSGETADDNVGFIAVATITEVDEVIPNQTNNFSDQQDDTTLTPGIGRSATQK